MVIHIINVLLDVFFTDGALSVKWIIVIVLVVPDEVMIRLAEIAVKKGLANDFLKTRKKSH